MNRKSDRLPQDTKRYHYRYIIPDTTKKINSFFIIKRKNYTKN